MPATSNPMPESGKKSVPVKWRDHAWLAPIMIRSANRRLAARVLWSLDSIVAADAKKRTPVKPAPAHWAKPQNSRSRPRQISCPSIRLYQRSRFNTSRSDNSL